MLIDFIPFCCRSYILLSLILWAFAGYAYLVNAKRPADDPQKKDFHPGAIFLAPITWPFLLLGLIVLFVIKAILYGVFLILFTIALVIIRKPFLLIWLDKIARRVGDKLLEANTILAKSLFGEWRPQPI